MTQPILPNVYRTGTGVVDRNLDEIRETFRRLQMGGGSGDHKVIVDATDTPGTAEEKIIGSGVTKTGAPGNRRLTITANDHLVKATNTDPTTPGGLLEKTTALGGTVLDTVVETGVRKLRIYSPPGYIDSVPPLHAHDQARWLLDEGRSYTFEPANTGHTPGGGLSAGGTAFQGVPGLRDAYCVRMMDDAHLNSPAGLFEYQIFTLHYWLRMETLPLAANPIVGIVKLSNAGAYTTPYYAVGLAFNDSGITARILKGVSPRTYVDLATAPALSQFKLGEWMHLAMTWDQEYLILYVNGREMGRSAAQTGVTIKYDGHGEWCVGHPWGQTSKSSYCIQDIRINDTAMTPAEIAEIWHRGNTFYSRIPQLYPSSSIYTMPSRRGFHDVTIIDGAVSDFADERLLRVSGTGPLVGIQNTGFLDGESLTLSFVADTEIAGMGSTAQIQIQGPWDGGSYRTDWTMPAGEEMEVRFVLNSGGTPFFKFVRGSML